MGKVAVVRSATVTMGGLALMLVGYHSIQLGRDALAPAFAPDAQFYRNLLFQITDLTQAAFAVYVSSRINNYGGLVGALYFGSGALSRAFRPFTVDSIPLKVIYALILAIAGSAAIRFAQLFPKEVTRADLPTRSASGRLRPGNALLRFLLIAPVVYVLVTAIDLFNWVIMPQFVGSMVRHLFVAAVALTYVRINYVGSDEEQRRKIFWIMQGILMILISIVLSLLLRPALGDWVLAIFMLGQLSVLLCVAFAVFSYGALDPRLMVRRTAIASVAAGSVVVLFVTVEAVVTNVLVDRLGLSEGAGPIVASVIAALLFRAVHTRAEAFVQRLLPLKLETGPRLAGEADG